MTGPIMMDASSQVGSELKVLRRTNAAGDGQGRPMPPQP